MTTRRNILTMMGLATAASPAIASQDFTRNHGGFEVSKYDPEKLATALERLAAEVRLHGRDHKKGVHVSRFHISTEAVGDQHWLAQTLTIDVEVKVDPEPA